MLIFLNDALSGIYPKKLAKKSIMNLKKFKKLSMQIDRQQYLHYIVNFRYFKLRFLDLGRYQSQESEEN